MLHTLLSFAFASCHILFKWVCKKEEEEEKKKKKLKEEKNVSIPTIFIQETIWYVVNDKDER